jgi:squalene-hopene/tetraprenyl-beta-curcumene cyclase
MSAVCGLSLFASGSVSAQETADPKAMAEKAANFLATTQAEDGSFTKMAGPGVTALVAAGLLNSGQPADNPVVAKALKYVEGFVKPDGGIYPDDSRHQNYETCIALVAFQAANKDGRYDSLLKNAEAYVRNQQWDDGEGISTDDPAYGGAGYGRHSRPDLSNTAFLMESLKELGRDANDEAMQRAVAFVSRCQNLESQYNQTKFASLNPDGGFFYTVAAGGESEAGELPNGGLRSYGSMSYAGLKSLIYAGVDRDDPRVKAALEWIGKHYTLEENPGMGSAGLYYYYHTFAKAMAAVGQEMFSDDKGVQHDWRQELIAELAKRQRPDGSWVNDNARWLENDPSLVTGYALLALGECEK